MLGAEHSRKLEEALKDQRAQMEKKAVTKAEKDQVSAWEGTCWDGS